MILQLKANRMSGGWSRFEFMVVYEGNEYKPNIGELRDFVIKAAASLPSDMARIAYVMLKTGGKAEVGDSHVD